MKASSRLRAAVLVAAVLASASCRSAAGGQTPPVMQPGSPGQPARAVGLETVLAATRPHTEADIQFMQGMIGHHAQALAMAGLAPGRTSSQDIRLLALRIEMSQVDEIALMKRWLEERGAQVPGISVDQTHHMMGSEHDFMPGMLTHEEMASLEAARGLEFDRLFLAFMIRHHEGALAMVDELRASPGGDMEDEISTLTIHIVADQRSEILRMEQMLALLRR